MIIIYFKLKGWNSLQFAKGLDVFLMQKNNLKLVFLLMSS